MRTITDSVYNQSPTPANPAYSASVPLSVYRELAAELQAAEVAIHQLNLKNEHLAQENYILRQEIAKTVNSVLQLQNAVNSSAHTADYQTKPVERNEQQYVQRRRQNVPPKRVKRQRKSRVVPQVNEFIEPLPEQVIIEEEQASYYYTDESEISQVSGWWLIFAIVSIIVMGFGAGYMVVRPLLESHTR